MASILARHPAIIEQWNYMMSLPNSYLVKNANSEMMRHVLNLSYNNIPHYLKACMLYLSLYEEDSIILKDDLVKQWISEGFIFAMEGNDREKVARSYFDELVNRGMIQPFDIDSSDEVLSCTVHYMVLHHIRHISIEENFITAIDHSQTATRLADKVRRLALHFGTEEDAKPPMSMRLSQVRSLAFFGLVRCMPSATQFRFLRVLILKLWAEPDEMSYCNLSGISELFQLRYLHVDACHVNLELPMQMRWLKDLVALQIEANVSAVPSDIVNMTGLLYLNLPSGAHLPTGIGNMTSLRTLGYFDLSSNSEENLMDLGKLTNLQELYLTCSTVQPADNLRKNMECLGLVLEKLSNLKCVTLVPAVLSDVNTHDDTGASSINVSCNILSSISPASTYLQRFELFPRFCIFRNLPNWFGEFHQLCILKIAVREICTEDIRILKALPALTALSLSVWTVPEGWIFIEEDGFPVLRYLKFTCAAPCLAFVEGAMSYVQRLILRFNANRLEEYNPADARFEHLSGLKEISVEIGGANADKLDLRVAENALLTAFKKHRSSTIIINLQWVHWIYYGDKKMGTSLQKKNYQTLPVKGVITDEQHGRKDKQVDSSLSSIVMRYVESISHLQNPGYPMASPPPKRELVDLEEPRVQEAVRSASASYSRHGGVFSLFEMEREDQGEPEHAHLERSMSEAAVEAELPRLRKSAFAHFVAEEDIEVVEGRRRAMAEEPVSEEAGGGELDVRACELMAQRIDSLLRNRYRNDLGQATEVGAEKQTAAWEGVPRLRSELDDSKTNASKGISVLDTTTSAPTNFEWRRE